MIFFFLRKKKKVSTKSEHEAGKVRVVFGNTGEQLYLQFNISLFDRRLDKCPLCDWPKAMTYQHIYQFDFDLPDSF